MKEENRKNRARRLGERERGQENGEDQNEIEVVKRENKEGERERMNPTLEIRSYVQRVRG